MCVCVCTISCVATSYETSSPTHLHRPTLRYAHLSGENMAKARAAVIIFATAIATYVSAWSKPMFEKMLAAASGVVMVFAHGVPWQIVSFSVRYDVQQHLDPNDMTPSVIVWSVRKRFKKRGTDDAWLPYGAPPTVYPKAGGPAGCLSDSLFIVSGLNVFFTIGHGDLLVFDSASLYHGTSPIVGESAEEEEALLQRPTPYGNALFVKKPDIVQAEAMKLGMQQCIMEGGRIVNEEGDELTKLQLRTKGREIIESVQQQMTSTAKKAKKC